MNDKINLKITNQTFFMKMILRSHGGKLMKLNIELALI